MYVGMVPPTQVAVFYVMWGGGGGSGWDVLAPMELGPKDVSLLERCPHFRGWYVCTDDTVFKFPVYFPKRKVPSFQRLYINTSSKKTTSHTPHNLAQTQHVKGVTIYTSFQGLETAAILIAYTYIQYTSKKRDSGGDEGYVML